MSLDHSPRTVPDAVPDAFDVKLLAFVLAIALLAASINIAYGGLPFALAAFTVLTVAGIGAHVRGHRRLRRATTGLVGRWSEAGGRIETVTRSSRGRTEWTIRTPDGDVVVSGVALEPLTQLTVEWNGITETKPIPTTDDEFDAVADEWYREIFDGR